MNNKIIPPLLSLLPFPFQAVLDGDLTAARVSAQLPFPLWTRYCPRLRSAQSLHQNTSVLGPKGAKGFDKRPAYYLFISDLLLHVKLEGIWCRDKKQTDSEAAVWLGASDFFLGP